jgi:biopolymer transport protein ExbD
VKAADAIGAARPAGGAHLNVTPLIDIVMVLIIFFLLVGQLALDRQGNVDLPEAVSGEPATPEAAPIAVAVETDGTLTIDGRTTQPDKLVPVLSVLLRQRPGSAVQIRADRSAAYASVRGVLDAAKEAGVRTVELAAKADGGAP